MKLDRNINVDGRGKYALVKLRLPMQYVRVGDYGSISSEALIQALADAGYIHIGNEGPGERFFVMKYKDKFTHFGLRSYANHVEAYAMQLLDKPGTVAQRLDLMEYAAEIHKEAVTAENHGNQIPT
jgi:hypothetical protein